MINDKVRQAVDNGDVQQTRTNLLMITLLDRGFSGTEFDDSLAYAKKLDGLFDEFDNEPEKTDEWNEDYWNYLYASLMDNFCLERIDLLRKVGKKVYPQKAKTINRPVGTSSPRPTGYSKPTGLSLPLKVGGSIVIAALGCATIGITKTALAAAVILGGAFALQKKGMR